MVTVVNVVVEEVVKPPVVAATAVTAKAPRATTMEIIASIIFLKIKNLQKLR